MASARSRKKETSDCFNCDASNAEIDVRGDRFTTRRYRDPYGDNKTVMQIIAECDGRRTR